jgi:hypothetical protein
MVHSTNAFDLLIKSVTAEMPPPPPKKLPTKMYFSRHRTGTYFSCLARPALVDLPLGERSNALVSTLRDGVWRIEYREAANPYFQNSNWDTSNVNIFRIPKQRIRRILILPKTLSGYN